MSENYALQLRHITKTFPGVKALDDVSFDARIFWASSRIDFQSTRPAFVTGRFPKHRLIKRLRSEGCAVIYISHKMEEIFRLSDYVTIMRDGSGRSSSPQIVTVPPLTGSKPHAARTISVRPAPTSPAKPTISQGNLPQREDCDHGRAHLVPHAA